MKKYLLKTCCVLLCIGLLSLTGCKKTSSQPAEKSGFYFNTTIGITIYDTDLTMTQKEDLLADSFSLCEKYEKMLSRTVEDSDIYRLNHAKGAPVTVSEETTALIEKALFYSDLTHDVFDCSIAPLSILWDFQGEVKKKPSDAAIKEALSHVDYRKVSIDGTTITLGDPDMALDLGGIAKGYIADQISSFLSDRGVTSALINLGGNVLTLGSKVDGSDFRVGVQRPFDDTGTPIAAVPMSGLSLVTSGIYERYFEEDGILYHHLLNPKTGFPFENNLYSVTILCDSSADADALSTSCFGLGLEEGLKLVEELDGVEALFITHDYELHFSSGFPQNPINKR